MARKLRIQYAGALYHVINRGNTRSDVFETDGAKGPGAREAGIEIFNACARLGEALRAQRAEGQ